MTRGWLSGVIGAIVGGIAVAAFTYYFLRDEPNLIFEKLPATYYHDSTRALSIYSVRLENSGNKVATQIAVEAKLQSPANFLGESADRSMDLIDVTAGQPNQLVERFHVDELNPGQYVTFSFLAEKSTGQSIYFEAATQGYVAKEEKIDDRETTSGLLATFGGLAGVTVAILVIVINLWQQRTTSELRFVEGNLGGIRLRMSRSSETQDTSKLEAFIKQDSLELVFNPANPRGQKAISFLPNGQIGRGRNHNETLWRIRFGFLEIINEDGVIQNRFSPETDRAVLISTNESDVMAIRKYGTFDQRIQKREIVPG